MLKCFNSEFKCCVKVIYWVIFKTFFKGDTKSIHIGIFSIRLPKLSKTLLYCLNKSTLFQL